MPTMRTSLRSKMARALQTSIYLSSIDEKTGQLTTGVDLGPCAPPVQTKPTDTESGSDRERLIEERKNGLPCTLVCGPEEGLSGGSVFTVRCVRPLSCIAAGRCFWRKFHKL